MKKKTKITYLIMLSILVLLLVLGYPTQTTYFGRIEITDKKVVKDTYYIDANLDDLAVEIIIDEEDSLVYEETPQKIMEVSISEIWDLIELDNNYLVRITTDNYRSTYTLERIYGY
ncbi:MAG: hypothetical protein N2B06_15305 [Clostridium sp.]